MLYDFIDTTSNISAGNYLPAEAMSFNGVYLENEIIHIPTEYQQND